MLVRKLYCMQELVGLECNHVGWLSVFLHLFFQVTFMLHNLELLLKCHLLWKNLDILCFNWKLIGVMSVHCSVNAVRTSSRAPPAVYVEKM